MSASHYSTLLSPGRIGSLELKNRMIVTAMGVNFAESDGSAGDRLIAYHEEQARGGVGMVITGATGVALPVGRVQRWQVGISEDRFLPGLEKLARAVQRHGARAAVQLHHGGLVAGDSARDGHPLWAPAVPSPVKDADFMSYFLPEELAKLSAGMKGPPQVKVLDLADIQQLVQQFAEGARRAKQAGFDGIEIHGGHGYILSSFISPKTNTRTDAYGGSVENRARLLLEVIHAVRAEVGNDFALWVKLDSREVGKQGGITLEDAKRTAQLVEDAGVDAITVSAYHETAYGKMHSESNIPQVPGANLPATVAIRQVVKIPLITSGRIELDVGEAELQKGSFDFLGLGRKLLADPQLPNKLAAGDTASIRPCVYCITCASAIYTGDATRCAVNAEVGVEHLRIARPRSSTPRHIVVVGGGPAGMEAARLLAADQHRVTLLERGPRLGGTLQFASLAYEPNQRFLTWLRREIGKAHIDLRLNTEATPALLASLGADAVIVATGARRDLPEIPGNDQHHVFSGDDMRKLILGESSERLTARTSPLTRLATRIGAATGLSANLNLVRKLTHTWMPLGRHIVIIGGELVGVELAEFLAERGRVVTVVDEAPRFGAGLPIVRRMRLLAELREHGVALQPSAADIRIEADAVTFRDATGSAQRVTAQQVIVAKGATGDTRVAQQLRGAGFEVHEAGDCTGVGYIEGAIRNAQQVVDAINAGIAPATEHGMETATA
jgi:2,4-dienoyl-CoA reductase-like NADH-dependent reductase (Old Yellow Enzyme family)/NADPH-dependent 2,4-dienoyl-CoA reductase/sulfur reductase-like enzyme